MKSILSAVRQRIVSKGPGSGTLLVFMHKTSDLKRKVLELNGRSAIVLEVAFTDVTVA
jgi:hypothetical protein